MNGWDVRPTLDRASATGRSLAQASGSLVADSPLPQALIQCRQRLTNELRLGTLVILSWSAPQPVADDSAVAQPTTASSLGSSAPQNGPGTRRHATSRARRHSAHIIACRAAWLRAPTSQNMAGLPQWRRYPAHNWRHFPARLQIKSRNRRRRSLGTAQMPRSYRRVNVADAWESQGHRLRVGGLGVFITASSAGNHCLSPLPGSRPVALKPLHIDDRPSQLT